MHGKHNGKHFYKKFTVRNWKTNELIKGDSQAEFCRKHHLSQFAFSDIMTKKRIYYLDYCHPDYSSNYINNIFTKIKIKNLETNEILNFKNKLSAAKYLNFSSQVINKILTDKNYRRGKFANVNFTGSVPIVVDKETASKIPIFQIKDLQKMGYFTENHRARYFLQLSRIPNNKRLSLHGNKNYKYRIKNKETGEIFTCMRLKEFAVKNGLKGNSLYFKNDKFEIIEG